VSVGRARRLWRGVCVLAGWITKKCAMSWRELIVLVLKALGISIALVLAYATLASAIFQLFGD
jgi:hypothetical protein